jgi:electron transfer flavoprotein alpha subunit
MLRRAPWCVARAASRAWRSFSAAPEVLVLAETDGCGALRPATHAALAAAAQLSGGASTLLVAGQGAAARSAADAAAAAAGVRDVLLADAPELQHGLAEPLAALLAALCTSCVRRDLASCPVPHLIFRGDAGAR